MIRAIGGANQTSPGKDNICYKMIKNEKISDTSLNIILYLYNRSGRQQNSLHLKLPTSWRHGVIVPSEKPGKGRSNAANYRSIALASNVCKIME